MHTLECLLPHPELRAFVRAYAQRQIYDLDAPIVEPVPARLEQVIEFPLQNVVEIIYWDGRRKRHSQATIIGLQTHANSHAILRDKSESFGIFFQPAGISQLFGIPMRDLCDRDYEGDSVLGVWIRRLWNQLGELFSFGQRVKLVEETLLRHAGRFRKCDRRWNLANELLAAQGVVSMVETASAHDLGLRQFERTFIDAVGISPKLHARIARFQTALDAKLASPRRTWIEIAHDLNYHDQMHMVHDFQRLAGDSPSSIVSKVGDMRPPALLSHGELHDISGL